jgi:hypothetical protein
VTNRSLRDYNADRYGPFLGVSDEGSAAGAIARAALTSPKARALPAPDPLALGVAHDAERLRSVGEVPVGPEEYAAIRAASGGAVLLTTNVGSHVNVWHYLQPPTLPAELAASTEAALWARQNGASLHDRDPQPWLRVRFSGGDEQDACADLVRAVAAEAPVAVAVDAEDGFEAARAALDLAAAAGARAVVIDGRARPPSEGRPVLPGLLNYFAAADTRALLEAATAADLAIEPALKVDTDSVANQVWTGLYAARQMGADLGKYGLFPLTFQESAEVVAKIQRWTADWTAAPAFYLDVPWIDATRVYEPGDAAEAAERWMQLVAGCGARVVLIDTVDKARGRRLIKADAEDERGLLTWDELDGLQETAARVGIRVLWAGGIPLEHVREMGRRRVFGVYVTSALAKPKVLEGEERRDIGLITAKEPEYGLIALVQLLLDAGFVGDKGLEGDASAAEQGDDAAAERLAAALLAAWRERFNDGST